MDVCEESFGTTQRVPHPDRLGESSSTGRRGPAAGTKRPSSWPPGRGEASMGDPEAKLGVVLRAGCAPGTPLFARDALSRLTEARQRVGDKAARRGKPAPRQGPTPAEATSSTRPTGVHLRPTQQAQLPVPTPGYQTRAEGIAAAMTGGRAPVCPAARAGSAPTLVPSSNRPPLKSGEPQPRAGGGCMYSPPRLRLPAAPRLALLD